VGPHYAAFFAHRISGGLDALLEALVAIVRRLENGAVNRELPAMVEAADAAFLDAAQRQRRAAVRAKLVEDADFPVAVPKNHQPLAQQRGAQRIAVRFRYLAGDTDRQPITPEDFTHGRARADPGDSLVVTSWKHGLSSGRPFIFHGRTLERPSQ